MNRKRTRFEYFMATPADNPPQAPAARKIDVRQVEYALERQARALDTQADRLSADLDYSAEFPAADADCMREAIALLRALPDVVPDPRIDQAIAPALPSPALAQHVDEGTRVDDGKDRPRPLCNLQRPGWRCTRAAGHPGPCAPTPFERNSPC